MIFKSIGKAFKKVFKGIGKAFKSVGKAIGKVVKSIGNVVKGAMKGDLMSVLMVAAAVYTGGAMLGAWSSPFASINGILAPGSSAVTTASSSMGMSNLAGGGALIEGGSALGGGLGSGALGIESMGFGGLGGAGGALGSTVPGTIAGGGALGISTGVGSVAPAGLLGTAEGFAGMAGYQPHLMQSMAGAVDSAWPINGRVGDIPWHQQPMTNSPINTSGWGEAPGIMGNEAGMNTVTAGGDMIQYDAFGNLVEPSMMDTVAGYGKQLGNSIMDSVTSGAKAFASDPLGTTWDVLKEIPSPAWGFAQGLFSPTPEEQHGAEWNARWEYEKNKMDYAAPDYVPTVRPSGQGLLRPGGGDVSRSGYDNYSVLAPGDREAAMQMGVSPYQYMWMKRTGQF